MILFQLTMVEVHSNVMMSRNQSQAPMLNMEFHHNEEDIHALTKKEYAARFADFMKNELQVPVSRYVQVPVSRYVGYGLLHDGNTLLCLCPSLLCSSPSLLCSSPSLLCSSPSLLCSSPSLLCSSPSLLCLCYRILVLFFDTRCTTLEASSL